MGYGDKSAKEKASEKASAASAAAAAAKEDADWEAGAKGGNKKKEKAEEKAKEKAERKAAAEEQANEEDEAMSASKPKGKAAKGGGGKAKMTRAEIAAKALADAEAKSKADAKKKKEIAKSGGNDYMGALAENNNSLDAIDASGIDAAVAALDMNADTPNGKRVNLKALYKAFEETELVRLKEEQPGLKLSQYKDRCWTNWQKSPDNPMNG